MSSFEKQLIRHGEKRESEQLQTLIAETSTNELIKTMKSKLGRSDFTTFWNYLLQGLSSDPNAKDKRFSCVQAFLSQISHVELTYKQTYDLVTRLCLDLPSFTSEQLIEVVEYCVDGVRTGDPKCVGWKDLLPETLSVLTTVPDLNVNGVSMSGKEYRNTIIKNICCMKWSTEVLTPIADMLKESSLQPNEVVVALHKFVDCFQNMVPSELPALSYQLFSMCTSASQIIIPLLGLDKYFYRFYYKKLFADISSDSTDFNSIDMFSEKEMLEAEETVLHHLNYCTQYKINEIQLCIVLRNFLPAPDVILTPFILSAILSMTRANREPDARLSSSIILPFLRSVIKNNEDEKKYAEYSVWCRDCLQRRRVDLGQLFTVMINQNKDGKDVITPGLVNLAFVLLKSKTSPIIYELGMIFLMKFIHKRFVFGQGVVKKLVEWMIVDQAAPQYSECLTMLSTTDTYTVSECTKSINYVLDFLLWIPGDQARRMMAFILPVLKISPSIRDMFIEILRKAMHSSDAKICCMGVYGFCMVLKQLNNSNSLRSAVNASGICTQYNISGLSLMSQSTLGSRSNPQRHFDMLTLEIIGLLRNCFNQNLEVKCTLYENLLRAVELNPKLVPHVLQFIDSHFRSYFDLSRGEDEQEVMKVNFTKLLHCAENNEMELTVKDNLGRLVLFVAHCLKIYDKGEHPYDTTQMRNILNTTVEQIKTKELRFENITGPFTALKNETIMQRLNLLEGLMSYMILSSTPDNENVSNILNLFKTHQSITENLKSMTGSKKGIKSKSGKLCNETEAQNLTINGVIVKKITSKPENIWSLPDLYLFLQIIHEESVPFVNPCLTALLRSNREFVRYVQQTLAVFVENIRSQPTYKQISHSQRIFKNLVDINKILYERCIRQLPTIWKKFDLQTAMLCADGFYQSLVTVKEIFSKKFNEFMKGIDPALGYLSKGKEAITIIQDIVDNYINDQEELKEEVDAAIGDKIPVILLQCLEVLYDNKSYSDRLTIESYTWLQEFCKNNEVHTKELGLVHKLLFIQRQKTHSGMFFNTIAMHLEKVLGQITEKSDLKLNFELKSITLGSAESCVNYLYSTLRQQIEEVEYFISKAGGLHYKIKVITDDEKEMCLVSLKSLERSICSQLIHIANTLLHLTNVSLPLGSCAENLIRILIQMYACLKNLAKHFINRSLTANLSIQGTKFDYLLQVVGKPLSNKIYTFITYIEANILEDRPKGKLPKPEAEKAKILRETRKIPKLVLFIENFNKNVILLSKKTDGRLAHHLHLGTVRDFRIKTSELKAAIDDSLSHSSLIEDASDEEQQAEPDEAYIDDGMSTKSVDPEEEVQEISSKSSQNSNDSVLKHESGESSNAQLLKNLAKINSQSRRRALRHATDNVEAPAAKRSRRTSTSAKRPTSIRASTRTKKK